MTTLLIDRRRQPLLRLLGLLLAMTGLVLLSIVTATVFARAAFSATTAQVTNDVEPFVHVDTLLLLLGAVTPFATALLTKTGASDAVKSAVSLLVTALVAVVVTGIEDGNLTVELWFNGWVQVLVTHAVTWLFTAKLVSTVNANTPGLIGPRSKG